MADTPPLFAPPRSAGSLTQRRVAQPWPADRDFRILSIDGGGIRGIFPARVLAGLEERFGGGRPIAEHFDLITGTSTGGIIALALGLGRSPADIAELYEARGHEIFPPPADTWLGRWRARGRNLRNYARYRYERDALQAMLTEVLGDARFGEARHRLCIPAMEGHHGEVYVFKTPHHPDYQRDQHETMLTVACATSAAPTYFQPLDAGGYRFVDGGLWANNPIMIGVVDALSCFDVPRHGVRVLSLGNDEDSFVVDDRQVRRGGKLAWARVIEAAMSLQSQNALGQARLLLGAERVLRLAPAGVTPPIPLDDWARARSELPALARDALDRYGERIAKEFMSVRVLYEVS
jgi:patatin-like phospholipase/acyl hydrolase